jgi:Bacterial NAD-glutamate dehydrogenase
MRKSARPSPTRTTFRSSKVSSFSTSQSPISLLPPECSNLLFSVSRNVLKTNFYQPTKVAISFRLDGNFLPEIEYPTKPLGVFIVVGSEFRGFHVRFRDVARGGIRIVRSRGVE